LLDQLDGAAEHATQRINLAIVARSPLSRLLTFAEERGWLRLRLRLRLRLLSSATNTYNRDYLAETAEGHQRPMLNVFHRDGRTIRHSWGSELFYAPTEPGQDPRHVGTIEPVWNLFDLTPEGARPTGMNSCDTHDTRRAGTGLVRTLVLRAPVQVTTRSSMLRRMCQDGVPPTARRSSGARLTICTSRPNRTTRIPMISSHSVMTEGPMIVRTRDAPVGSPA
jgi:hypothetical protein